MRTGIIVSIAAVLVLAGVLLGVFVLRNPVDKPANVLLITVDTLRPDRLGYAGHTRDTSPAIDGLAAKGLVFPNTYSVSRSIWVDAQNFFLPGQYNGYFISNNRP